MSTNLGSQTKRTPIWAVLLGCVFYFYFIVAMFSVPYFNWKYAQKNGFVSWLFFGEVIATAKAIVWPYFVFAGDGGLSKVQKKEMRHLRDAMTLVHESIAVFQKATNPNDSRIDNASQTLRKALGESKSVSDPTLAAVHPELPNQLKDNFRAGIEALIRGMDERNDEFLIDGQKKLSAFDDFWNDHREEFK